MFNMPPSFLIVTIACTVWLVVWLADRRVRATAKGLDQQLRGQIPTFTGG
jgi:zinc/manganese transport system permease protein